MHRSQAWTWGRQDRTILESPIRTLTLTSAWRLLPLVAGLLVALLLPGFQPVVLAADNNGTISGIVVVESSSGPKPVAGAEVRLTFGSKGEIKKTGADGRYSFTGLLAGKYTIRVTPPGDLKTKGDGTITVSLDAGDTERADFGLLAPATPTPTPAPPTPKTTPAPAVSATPAQKPSEKPAEKPAEKPTAAQSTPQASHQNGAAAAAAAVAAVQNVSPSSLLQPSASPVGTAQAGAQARSSATPATGAPGLANALIPPPPAPGASPAPFLFGTPGLIVAAASPTPDVTSPQNAPPVEDVLASGPPRRLITSFEALRQTAGGASASQLKSWATETSLVLGVPFRTQIDGTSFSLVNCGPASLAMVLVAFGLDVDPPSVRDYLNHLVGNYDTEAGTSLYVLARIAREAGLNTFGTSAGLQGWTVEAIREHVRAGHPVITLTKYRFLPGHFGSVTDFDHYIVITGMAGEDFVYNDAAYSTEYGYNLLISPQQLERAWAASSVPRHAVAIGFGDSLKPLPIVPNRLTAESLAAAAPADDVNAVAPSGPTRINRGAATEWLREQMLDRLGARTAVVSGLPSADLMPAPRTRLDPSDLPVSGPAREERPTGDAIREPAIWDDGRPGTAVADAGVARPAEQVALAPVDAAAPASLDGSEGNGTSWVAPVGLGLMSFGIVLAFVGRFSGIQLSTVRVRLSKLPPLPRVRIPRRR